MIIVTVASRRSDLLFLFFLVASRVDGVVPSCSSYMLSNMELYLAEWSCRWLATCALGRASGSNGHVRQVCVDMVVSLGSALLMEYKCISPGRSVGTPRK